MTKEQIMQENKEEIIRLYQDNVSATKIAGMFDTSAATICKYLKQWGVEVSNKQNQLHFDLEKDIIPEYRNGVSLSKLAAKYHTTVPTLSRRLKALGIEIINRQNVTKFNEHIFDSIDTEEKAYWLGFIFADGYISSNPLDPSKKARYDFELSLSIVDLEHLHKFNKFMEHNKCNIKTSIVKQDDKEFERCRWSIVNKHLWETLNSYGCTPRKSTTLEFPLIFEDDSLLISFIRGYFDGDGCLTYYQHPIRPKAQFLGTINFLNKLKEHLNRFGIKTGSIIDDSRGENVHILTVSQTDTLKFLDLIYNNSNIFLTRKLNRYNYFKTCRSSEQLLELLQGKNGEDWDVNTVLTDSIAQGESVVQSVESE